MFICLKSLFVLLLRVTPAVIQILLLRSPLINYLLSPFKSQSTQYPPASIAARIAAC
jgi:hypothetical protein